MRNLLLAAVIGTALVTAALAAESHTRRVTGAVTHVDRKTGRVTVRAEGHDVQMQYPRAKARRTKVGDRVTVLVAVEPVPKLPGAVGLRGDPGPSAREIPPPAGYPVGPGMGPIGAGSPNAGPGSPVGADGAR